MWIKKKSFAPGIVMLSIAIVLICISLFAVFKAIGLGEAVAMVDYNSTEYQRLESEYEWIGWFSIFSVFIIIGIVLFLVLGIRSLVAAGKTQSIYKKQAFVQKREKEYFAAGSPQFDINIPFGYRRFALSKTQKLYFMTPRYRHMKFGVHRLDDISQINISENNNVVMDGDGAGALVGGLLFGAAGAIIGAGGKRSRAKSMIDSLCINIVTNNVDDPHVQIEFLDYPLARASKEFEYLAANAQKVYATLQSYVSTTQKSKEMPGTLSTRLGELAKLREAGTITEQEFNEAKAKILEI